MGGLEGEPHAHLRRLCISRVVRRVPLPLHLDIIILRAGQIRLHDMHVQTQTGWMGHQQAPLVEAPTPVPSTALSCCRSRSSCESAHGQGAAGARLAHLGETALAAGEVRLLLRREVVGLARHRQQALPELLHARSELVDAG